MKRTSLSALLLVLVVASAWAQGTKPNFSGTWQLDAAKSEFGPMPPPSSMLTVIDHKDPKVVIKTSQKSEQGDVVNERTITTDGKPNTNKLKSPMGDQDVTSTTNWSGNQLVTEFKMEINGTGLEFRDTYTLSDDGKILTVVRDIKSEQGPLAMKMVFNKQ